MKGLQNIGNTCYLNSGLQMLLNIPELCSIIKNNNNNDDDDLIILNNFINDYNDTNISSPLVPINIKKMVEKRNNIFIGSNQHDSVEFVIFLLDIIDNALSKNNIKNFNNIFSIKNKTTIKCKNLNCLNLSETIENNNYLMLDIDEKTTNLDECYRLFKSSERFTNDNLYNCEKCKTKSNASKRYNIIEWPKVLIIWLKRFNQSGTSLQKNNQSINIPLKWRHNMHLYGAIIHMGNLNGGHYVYIGLHNNNWYLYNDSSISVINDVYDYLNNSYVLYYRLL